MGGEVDKLVETHGLNEYDKIQARRHAERSATNMYDQHYVDGQGADQYDTSRYDRPPQFQ